MSAGFVDQLDHFLDHHGNVLYLGTDVAGHIYRGCCCGLKIDIVIVQRVHLGSNNISAVLVFTGKLTDNQDAVHNGIAGIFDLLDRRDHTVQIVFDAVCHSTVRFVQMADGHTVADITKNDAGQLKLIILHVRGGVHTKNSVAVNGAADNDQGIHNAAVPHEKLILIDHQKTGNGKNISKCDRRRGRTDHICIENTITDHQIQFVAFRIPAPGSKQDLSGNKRNPAKSQKDQIISGAVQTV